MFLRSMPSQWHWRLFSILAAFRVVPSGVNAASEDYYVHTLPGAPSGMPLAKMHAGHIQITPEHDRNLFFWQFENEHTDNRSRLVIWLNGGPGCSSEGGALMEIGPYRVQPDGSLEWNNGSWNEFATLLFVDSPVGTGFSYAGDPDGLVHEIKEGADQLIIFLEQWFEIFPEHCHDDIYLAGESFAGQFIPYISKAILERNQRTTESWNLKGLLIGNGWLSGAQQYPAYVEYAYQNGLLEVGSVQAQAVEERHSSCIAKLSEGNQVAVIECRKVLTDILYQSSYVNDGNERVCYNMYDVREKDEYPSCGLHWPPSLQKVTQYLHRSDVISALHIDLSRPTPLWKECSGVVGGALQMRHSTPSITLIPELLQELPILLYSGDQDMTCNHVGTENIIDNLQWNGGQGFGSSPRLAWTFNDELAGFYQQARNLTYVLFYNASIMVPHDQPRRSRDMLDRFMGVNITGFGGEPVKSIVEGLSGEQNAQIQLGEIALATFVFLAAASWIFYVCLRRKQTARGYRSVFTSDPDQDTEAKYTERTGLETADVEEHLLEEYVSISGDNNGRTSAE